MRSFLISKKEGKIMRIRNLLCKLFLVALVGVSFNVGAQTIGKLSVRSGEAIRKATVSNNLVRIFPNPATEYIVVRFKRAGFSELRMLNTVGETVHYQRINPEGDGNVIVLNVADYKRGLYMIQLRGTDAKVTRKLILR